MKTIPKSLHTLTVIVNVARVLDLELVGACGGDSVTAALDVLGYTGAPDEHQLASKARAILAKSVQS